MDMLQWELGECRVIDVFICLHVHDSTALILALIVLWLFGKLPVKAAGFTEKGMLPKFSGGEACPL